MRTNDAGLTIIREAEGLRLTAYRDNGGLLTIGYGHTGPDVRPGATITEEVAERLLLQDVARAEAAVTRQVQVPLNENQYSALVSFSFNLGERPLRNSTLLRFLNARQYLNAANEFPKWCLCEGQKLPGLVKRRAAERALFLLPVLAAGTDIA